MLVKVCGMTLESQLQEIKQYVDFTGFIYYSGSPRCIDSAPLVEGTKRVGVFVNEDSEKVLEIAARDKLDLIQLHGSEAPGYCRQINPKYPVIKAFGIDDSFNFETLCDFDDVVTYFLFDTYTPKHGGSGKVFNWDILSQYRLSKPFFLSGGINIDSVKDIRSLHHPQLLGIDINSGFEEQPGIKLTEHIIEFTYEIKRNIHTAR